MGSPVACLIGGGWCGSLRRVPDDPVPDDAAGLRAANARLRGLLAERDSEVAALRAGRDADREVIRRLGLRLAELERRLDMDSGNSGTPSSKERIGAKEARRARQQSERERSKDRKKAVSQVTGARGCNGTRIQGSGRTHRRRRSAVRDKAHQAANEKLSVVAVR
jgi:hypothetical protein